jgi:hypothetical protein
MTDAEIRRIYRRVRLLAEAVLGPFAREIEVEDPSGAILDGIVAPSLDAVRDHSLLLDLEDLDAAIDDLLLLRAHTRLTRERALGGSLGEEEPLAPEESQASPREPSRGSCSAARGGDCGCWSCEALRSLSEAAGEPLPEREPQSYGEAIAAAIRERTGGALPLSDHDER